MTLDEKIDFITKNLPEDYESFIEDYFYNTKLKCFVFYVKGKVLDAQVKLCKIDLPFEYRVFPMK